MVQAGVNMMQNVDPTAIAEVAQAGIKKQILLLRGLNQIQRGKEDNYNKLQECF